MMMIIAERVDPSRRQHPTRAGRHLSEFRNVILIERMPLFQFLLSVFVWLSFVLRPSAGALSSLTPTTSPQRRSMSSKILRSFDDDDDKPYDIVIIGGGVVGLAVARAAVLRGYPRTLVLEREPDLLSWASGSNSGIVCTGVDATPGTLERALIRDAISQLPAYLQLANIPHDPCGSLVCQWSWDEHDAEGEHEPTDNDKHVLAPVLRESHEAGDRGARLLDTAQVLQEEPHLDSAVRGAVHIPGEIVVDPWLYSMSLAVQARANGCQIYTNAEVEQDQMQWDKQLWAVPVNVDGADTVVIRARTIVCATGAWAVDWDKTLMRNYQSSTETIHDSNNLEAAPRRGQYRIYRATPSSTLRHPIQPIPTEFTKGIFVFASLYNHIIVGPTALDQESKTDRSTDAAVAAQLDQHAQRVLPNLDVERDLVGEYVGIRPGTNQRDYQIRTHFVKHWITIAGIRSTGLTASLGIGRHVTHLLEQILRDAGVPNNPMFKPVLPALPPVQDLIREFQQRNDGCVEIQGHVYRVTHPVTLLGWKHYNLA